MENSSVRKNETKKAKLQMFFFICLPSVLVYLSVLCILLTSETAVIFLLIALVYCGFGAWICASASMIVKNNVSLIAPKSAAAARKQLADSSKGEEKDNPYMRMRVMRNGALAVLLFVPIAAAGWLLFILYCCGKFLRKLSQMAKDCDTADTMIISGNAAPRDIAECFSAVLRYAKTYNILGEKKGFTAMLHRAEELVELWEQQGDDECADNSAPSNGQTQGEPTRQTSTNTYAVSAASPTVTQKSGEMRRLTGKAILFLFAPGLLYRAGTAIWRHAVYEYAYTSIIDIIFGKFAGHFLHPEIIAIASIILYIAALALAVTGAVYCALNMHGWGVSGTAKYAPDCNACREKMQWVKSKNTDGINVGSVFIKILIAVAMILPVLYFGWLLFVLYRCDFICGKRKKYAADCDAACAVLLGGGDVRSLVRLFNRMADYAVEWKACGKRAQAQKAEAVAGKLLAATEALYTAAR